MIGIVYGYCVKHGGIGRYISEYLKHIKRKELEVICIEGDIELLRGIRTLCINCDRDTRFMSTDENKSFSEAIKKISGKYDIIHSHGIYDFIPDIYTAHICLESYFSKFIDIFGKSNLPDHLKEMYPTLIELENKIISNFKNERGLIVVSKKVKDEICNRYNLNEERVNIIRGASRFYRRKRERIDFNIRQKKEVYKIGFIGGNLYAKGIVFIKDVLSKLASRGFRIECIGAGCGDNIKEFLNSNSKYRTKILGKCEINEDFYRDLDAFLNLSIYEAYSLSTLEAMSLGIPVISSTLNGIFYDAEQEQKDLVLAKIKDISNCDEIANMLERILSDEDFKRGIKESGYKIARQNTWEDVSLEYLKIYQRDFR